MAGVWSRSGQDEVAGLAGFALDEEAVVGMIIGEFVGAIGGEVEGAGLLDGLGEGSGLGAGRLVRRGSDFRAS